MTIVNCVFFDILFLALFVLFYALISTASMVRASSKLHKYMLYNILRSPMSFFDMTPIGRILNQFSRYVWIFSIYLSLVLSGNLQHSMPGLKRIPLCTTFIGLNILHCRDIETIDNILPNLLRSWINNFFLVISTIVVISYSTPVFLSVVIPLGLLYNFIQVRHLQQCVCVTSNVRYIYPSKISLWELAGR